MKDAWEAITTVGLSFLVFCLIGVAPLVIIWSLNTVFTGLNIPINGWSWLAVLLLAVLIKFNINVSSD